MPIGTTWPSMFTSATTGEGGNPPPAKVPERSPPQMLGCTPITPEAFKRFTAYPRASPCGAHTLGLAGMARLVLNATNPPTITADVTVCSPLVRDPGVQLSTAPGPQTSRSMNQPDLPAPGMTSDVEHVVGAVKSCIVVPSSRFAVVGHVMFGHVMSSKNT